MSSLNLAVETVSFIIRAGSKEQGGLRLIVCAVSEDKGPETVDHDRAAVRLLKRPERNSSLDVIRIDRAVAEISDQEFFAESAEPGRRLGQTPGSIECALRNQAPN